MKTSSKLGAAAILILLALLPMNIACAQAQKQQVLQQSIKTIYPTKDLGDIRLCCDRPCLRC